MTDDASPENLRKFLESDDPAMVRMGISLAKGAGVEVTIKDLVHLLKSENVETIKIGFAFAEEVGVGDEAMAMLCEALGDENDVRAFVARALGKIGDARAVEPLIKVLKEREWPDSPAAAEALGKIGDERAVEPLIRVQLDDVEEEVSEAAGEALREFGEPAVVVRLSSVLDGAIYDAVWNRSGEYEPVERAARALGRVGGAGAVEALISAIDNLYSYLNMSKEVYLERYDMCATYVMEALGDAGAVDPLIVALSENGKTDYGDVHESAYEALIGIGRPAVPALVEALSAKDSGTRSGVARALKAIGWEPDTDKLKALYLIALEDWKGCIELGEPAVEVLVEALETCPQTDLWNHFVTVDLRVGAAESLGELGDVRALESLSKILEMNDNVIMLKALSGQLYEYTVDLLLAAIKALGKIGDARAIEPLVEVLGTVPGGWDWPYSMMTAEYNDKEITQIVLSVSAEVLKKLGHEVERGHDVLNNERILIEKLGDDDLEVYLSAVRVLGEIGGSGAVEPLIKALKDEEEQREIGPKWMVRGRSAEALGKIGDVRAVEPLIKALGSEAYGGEYVRRNAASALGEIGDTQAIEPLIKALGDERSDVRKYAKEALRKLGHEVE